VIARILDGTFDNLSSRFRPYLAITAGWDSRVLLAAARRYLPQIRLHVDRMGVLADDHRDVAIPRRLAQTLGLTFRVDNSHENLPDWLASAITNNVGRLRNAPKLRAIYNRLKSWPDDAIEINGGGSEVCRNALDKYNVLGNRRLRASSLAHLVHFKGSEYVERILAAWQDALLPSLTASWRVADMLYWEHRVGLWGAMYTAEQDAAVESVSPFNNRLLLETMLSVDGRHRRAPSFRVYRDLIREMWPEVECAPINPGRRRQVDLVVRWLPAFVIRWGILRFDT
jgi:hypothetical protein